jgi:hypothetical protein
MNFEPPDPSSLQHSLNYKRANSKRSVTSRKETSDAGSLFY